VAGAGAQDATRRASGCPALWKQILLMNRENVLAALEHFGATLSAMHAALRDGDEAELERFLTLAKKNRDALGS
jgi:prephenate dehydrogenase